MSFSSVSQMIRALTVINYSFFCLVFLLIRFWVLKVGT